MFCKPRLIGFSKNPPSSCYSKQSCLDGKIRAGSWSYWFLNMLYTLEKRMNKESTRSQQGWKRYVYLKSQEVSVQKLTIDLYRCDHSRSLNDSFDAGGWILYRSCMAWWTGLTWIDHLQCALWQWKDECLKIQSLWFWGFHLKIFKCWIMLILIVSQFSCICSVWAFMCAGGTEYSDVQRRALSELPCQKASCLRWKWRCFRDSTWELWRSAPGLSLTAALCCLYFGTLWQHVTDRNGSDV